MKLIAFLGPSRPLRLPVRCTVLPPARQGDVWRALRQRPDAIALIDGVFESQPSVWHHELLDALDAGVAVYGGASMGALRAAELHSRGMIGVGQIFRWYRDEVLSDDSEVALLHADAAHGFRPLTVPLVNVRWSAQEAVRRKQLRPAEALRLVERAAQIFYQERTWERVTQGAKLPLLDLKALDAAETLRAAAKARRGWAAHPRQPAPSSLVRRARALQDGLPAQIAKELPARAAEELIDAGLRRALLAGWAREQGLKPEAAELAAAERRWRASLRVKSRTALLARAGLDEAQLLRLCEDLALERLVLDHSQRMLSDGPSREEALFTELRLRGK